MTDRQTDGHYRQTCRERDRETERESHDRQTDRQTDRQDKQNSSFAPASFRMHLQHIGVHIIGVL